MNTRKIVFATFTVVTKAGVRYDADHLTAHLRDFDLWPMLSFICSGRLNTMDAYEVERVEYHAPNPEVTSVCNRCDQHLMGEVGIMGPEGRGGCGGSVG